MAKTRLNASTRDLLKRHARDKLDLKDLEEQEKAAKEDFRKKLKPAVDSHIPPETIRLMQRYGVPFSESHIFAKLPNGSLVSLVNPGIPWFAEYGLRHYTANQLPISKDVFDAHTGWETANERLTTRHDELLSAFETLIQEARYFEDLCEVWPEAEELADRITSKNAVALVESPQAKTVRKYLEKKKAA